jgi:hypothetical protein
MATLDILTGPSNGPLTALTLRRGPLPQRTFYALPEFMRCLKEDLPKWRTGKLQASQTPEEQMRSILNRWLAGRPMDWDRHMKDLMPMEDEAWEMKTADLRLWVDIQAQSIHRVLHRLCRRL